MRVPMGRCSLSPPGLGTVRGLGTVPGPVSQVSGNCWISGAEALL